MNAKSILTMTSGTKTFENFFHSISAKSAEYRGCRNINKQTKPHKKSLDGITLETAEEAGKSSGTSAEILPYLPLMCFYSTNCGTLD